MCIRDSSFDGIINNTPTVDELEAKVKAGETISLVDLANAVKADKERGQEDVYKRQVLDSKKVSDHHAIIPTMERAKADPDALPESEKNILCLLYTSGCV